MSRVLNVWMRRSLQLLAVGGLAAALVGCGERPPVVAKQLGYRGTGMEQVSNPRLIAEAAPLHVAPPSAPAASPEGPKAGQVYQNVKVLGNLSVAEFSRNMAAITEWVAPKEGCNYCHNAQNFADDSKYTKVVARRMIQMTQHLNVDWQKHVGNTGVTCYTCHRGNPVPAQVWYKPADRKYTQNSVMGDLAGQNMGSASVGYSSLPFDPFTPYLKEDKQISLQGKEALKFTGAKANLASTKQAEHTYGLMIHMATSLGVNCTFCHNTRNFADWKEAPPQRVTAWHGIRMARDLNVAYMEPLTSTFPANRLGVHGDVAKVNCASCHQGVNKPLNGAAMAKNHPELLTTAAYVPAAAAPAMPAAMADAMRAVLYFGVNSPKVETGKEKGWAELLAALKDKPDMKVAISGYHSASGTLAANQELAKKRAFAVRDMLAAAGVAGDRVVLEKPQQVQANSAGEDAESRRVEVTVK
jgi:photosynthetic reaction center cytochrome c subunit